MPTPPAQHRRVRLRSALEAKVGQSSTGVDNGSPRPQIGQRDEILSGRHRHDIDGHAAQTRVAAEFAAECERNKIALSQLDSCSRLQ